MLSSLVEIQVLSCQSLGDDDDLLDLTSMAPGHGHGHGPAHGVGESDLEMRLRPWAAGQRHVTVQVPVWNLGRCGSGVTRWHLPPIPTALEERGETGSGKPPASACT